MKGLYGLDRASTRSNHACTADGFYNAIDPHGCATGEQVDSGIHYLVAHLVMADLNSAHIPGLKLFQSSAA